MNRRNRFENKRGIDDEPSEGSSLNALLSWTIVILILISAAVASWVGSFYIFGHPEEPFSYKVMTALKKIEPPKRFELTAAPQGEFLTPEAIFARFASMPAVQLAETNRQLLRAYIRNYKQTKEIVPYIIGQFTILESYELGPNDFFPSGVVAVAKANNEPRVLMEHVFTTKPSNIENLQRLLLTGLEINLQRRMDFSAVINVRKLSDGRILFTAVPLLYGTYASAQGPGTFSLEPPATLNVGAGLPIVRGPRLDAAFEKYSTYRRRLGLPSEEGKIASAANIPANRLIRVARPEPVGEVATLNRQENPQSNLPPPASTPSPTPQRILPALPVEPPVSSQPIADSNQSPANPSTAVEPNSAPTPVAQTSPTSTNPTQASTVIANVRGRSWEVYEPGRMPRGRLITADEIPRLAERGLQGERIYIEGIFDVTAANEGRAVMRSRRNAAKFRIIVDFPIGYPVPKVGEQVNRNDQRPFLITGISVGADGVINVQAREITRP